MLCSLCYYLVSAQDKDEWLESASACILHDIESCMQFAVDVDCHCVQAQSLASLSVPTCFSKVLQIGNIYCAACVVLCPELRTKKAGDLNSMAYRYAWWPLHGKSCPAGGLSCAMFSGFGLGDTGVVTGLALLDALSPSRG